MLMISLKPTIFLRFLRSVHLLLEIMLSSMLNLILRMSMLLEITSISEMVLNCEILIDIKHILDKIKT